MNEIDLPNWVVPSRFTGHKIPLEITNIEDFNLVGSVLGIYNKSVFVDYKNVTGFIYLVTFSNGKKYLGKKSLFHERTVNKGKKELANMTDKRLSKKKKIIKESDWQTYIGSWTDEILKDELESGKVKVVSREVIQVASSKTQLTYLETKYLFLWEVIEREEFINGNILGKFYSKHLEIKK